MNDYRSSSSLERSRQKLRDAGIPEELHERFVDFQLKHGGERGAFGLNTVIWGILLDAVQPWSAMIPGAVVAEEVDGIWQVVCADVHLSDTMTIDQFGRLYWSYQPRYSDFELFFQGREPDIA